MDHIIEAAAPAKYKHIDFKPPEGVRKAAKRGLEMRKEHGRGGTAVGVARARDLMNGKTISPSTARRMKAYFDRHQPDQKAEGFDSGEEGYPSAGRVAWLLWGGDAGYAWAKKLVKQMNSADGKVSASATTRTYYHGGAKKYGKLLPSKDGVFGAGIYLTTDKKSAERYARSAGSDNGGGITEVNVTVDPEKVWSVARRYDLRYFTDAPWLDEMIKKYGEGAAIKDGMNAAVYLFGNDNSKIKDLGYQAFQTRSTSPTDHDLLVLDDSIISYPNDSWVSDEEVLASFKLRTPTGIPGLRDDDDHAGGYGDFTAALFGALSREKVMDLVEMVGVRMLRALAGPALNGSLKRLLPSLTDSFNIGRKVPITEQEVLSLALRQAKDAAKMDLSARHKALLSEVKSVLESELRGKELPPGDYSMKVPEATDTGDEMYEHLSRRSVKASPCGCDSGCACSTPQNSSGQPPSDMTISNLKQIVRDAQELLERLHEDMEIMGWAEDQVSQAKAMINSVRNYVETDFGHEASEAVVLTVAAAKKPWEEKREPEGKLSKRWREEAEKRAKKAGRKYPNQVDNMWAKQQQNEARASVAAALLSAADVLSRGGER